jgi:hypothetical protein
MARRKKSSSQAVSLFPFLSILACVIGVLTLMITALALGQMDTEAVADLEVLEQAPKLIDEENKKAEQTQRETDKLQEQLKNSRGSAGERQREILIKKAELQKLLDQLEKAKKDEPNLPPIQLVDKAQLDQRLVKIQEEFNEVDKNLKKLESQLSERKKPPEEAVVQVRPSGSGVDLEPTFVECAKTSIVVYDGPKQKRIRSADIETDEEFGVLLDEIAKKEKASVIFLVRDDALGTYYRARNAARAHYARNGKLPVLGQGKIDLSIFKPK